MLNSILLQIRGHQAKKDTFLCHDIFWEKKYQGCNWWGVGGREICFSCFGTVMFIIFFLAPNVFTMANSSSTICLKKHRVHSPWVCQMLAGLTPHSNTCCFDSTNTECSFALEAALHGVENKLFISEDHILLFSRVSPWDGLLNTDWMSFNKCYQ